MYKNIKLFLYIYKHSRQDSTNKIHHYSITSSEMEKTRSERNEPEQLSKVGRNFFWHHSISLVSQKVRTLPPDLTMPYQLIRTKHYVIMHERQDFLHILQQPALLFISQQIEGLSFCICQKASPVLYLSMPTKI